MPGTRIVAGLGNPGPAYERTRHNVGFRVVDELARRFGVERLKTKDGAAQAHVAARAVVLVKPLTFMNESGGPLGRVVTWWKATPPEILVVSDDLDLPFGRLRMRADGSSGGHNGLKSIIARIGSDFPRLRIGIGRGRDTIDYVLGDFSAAEERALPAIVDACADAVEIFLAGDLPRAIESVNGRRDLGAAP